MGEGRANSGKELDMVITIILASLAILSVIYAVFGYFIDARSNEELLV